ncbi:MAG: hypothetical protein ACFNZX_01300 [Actinomyces sp.]
MSVSSVSFQERGDAGRELGGVLTGIVPDPYDTPTGGREGVDVLVQRIGDDGDSLVPPRQIRHDAAGDFDAVLPVSDAGGGEVGQKREDGRVAPGRRPFGLRTGRVRTAVG